jgi:hypothetical protein
MAGAIADILVPNLACSPNRPKSQARALAMAAYYQYKTILAITPSDMVLTLNVV